MIRIGVLIDGLQIKVWQREILEFIQTHPSMEISALIIKNNSPNLKSKGAFLYRVSQAVDRKLFKTKENIFSVVDISPWKDNYECFYINGIEKKFSYRFSDEEVNKITNLNLDLLIRFGFGILRGDILKAAKNGVWSLHHGDNRINRGGPPAFWEVVNRESVTGITLQKLSEDLDGGKVIKRSFIKTNITSFNRNKTEAFRAGIELFQMALQELSENNLELLNEKIGLNLYSYPLYKDPGNTRSAIILFNFWVRRLKELYNEQLTPQWYLLYKFDRENLIEKSVFRYKKLIPPKGYDWADPFIIKQQDSYFLFFEELEIKSGKGHISFLQFDNTGNLVSDTAIKILEEPYHLSYPFIVEHNSNYYMLPESANADELWLYKCISFPDKWQKEIRIFDNKKIYDASLYFHEGNWYLFGTEALTAGGSRDQYLHIYYSKDLISDTWAPHPANPVTMDVRGSRPAGNIFKYKDKILRPAQIGAPKYGYGIQFREIIQLSPTEFSEINFDEITPKWESNLLATHTFNNSKGFTVLDAQSIIKR